MRKLSNTQKTISLLLKAIAAAAAIVGTVMSARGGRNAFMGGGSVFMYFTIQSNIVLALICLLGGWFLLRDGAFSDRWYVIKFVGTVSITITGAVFCFILAPTMKDSAWKANNVLTHVVVPLACIADFFVTGLQSSIPRRKTVYAVLPPLAYVIYAGIGYCLNWKFSRGTNYPYFFLNWGSPAGAFGFTKELPFMGCVWWICIGIVLILLFGDIYLRLLALLKKRFHA